MQIGCYSSMKYFTRIEISFLPIYPWINIIREWNGQNLFRPKFIELLAHTFASPYLGHEPKARVATTNFIVRNLIEMHAKHYMQENEVNSLIRSYSLN